ncbi:hypothetical protein LTR64_003989 [Lithohypha guttulata]|uniref:uncharacterized protein n=1 Tax=Lithohypha guttulata TaxID=1690604 RepID=UPI002DE13513|nr:hypothetical protein LTR51_006716 [Lithohypha guttulata]
MNSARTLNAREALSTLYVMPFQRTSNDTILLHFICVIAHQIVDGLTTFRWAGKIAEILNMDGNELDEMLGNLFTNEHELRARLPLAQEAFYPLRSQNKARERWHWLLTRVLRHVRHPPPAAFQNPLRRQKPLAEARPLPPTYRDVLDYSQTPPLNSGRISGDLYGRSVQNMRKLCKEAGFSIGSGLFTLVSMAMMEMEERRNPGESPNGSCMLAFSDGVTLPFLPHDLDFVGRFKLLGRLAHRQLRQYQKRKRSLEEEIHLGSRSPSQLIPALFCSTTERMENRADAEAKAGINVQGSLPAKASPSLATCGISSVGDISVLMTAPKVDLSNLGGKDLVAEFKGISSLVRPRDGEFLVGAYGDSKHLSFGVSYDANAIDPAKAEEWKMVMESLLDRDLFAVTQAKL